MKKSVIKIQSSDDVDVEYSGEPCGIDAIHIVTVGNQAFPVSYRSKYDLIPEPQIVLLGDDEDVIICTTKKLTKTQIANAIKTAFISYMLANGKMILV